jgi:hypothetical protein
MSKMGELVYDIQMALKEGNLSFREIAYRFEVPYDWVVTIAEEMAEPS